MLIYAYIKFFACSTFSTPASHFEFCSKFKVSCSGWVNLRSTIKPVIFLVRVLSRKARPWRNIQRQYVSIEFSTLTPYVSIDTATLLSTGGPPNLISSSSAIVLLVSLPPLFVLLVAVLLVTLLPCSLSSASLRNSTSRPSMK